MRGLPSTLWHDITPLHAHLVSYIVTVRLFCRCSRIWGRFCASRPDILLGEHCYVRVIVATPCCVSLMLSGAYMHAQGSRSCTCGFGAEDF